MHLNQDPIKVIIKRASNAELSRWRNEWTDLELLTRPSTDISPQRNLGNLTLATLVASEQSYSIFDKTNDTHNENSQL